MAALADGAVVFARDVDARPVPLPRSLHELRPRAAEPSWTNQMARVHADDRPSIVHTWWQAVRRPGEVHLTVLRSEEPTGWTEFEVRFLNLLDDPDFGVALIIVGPGRPITTPPAAHSGGPAEDTPSWVVQELDVLGTVLRSDGPASGLFGTDTDPTGHNILEVVHPDDHDMCIRMWVELIGEPGAARTIRHRVRGDGAVVWVESTLLHRRDANDVSTIVVVAHDITAERANAVALQQSREAFRVLAEEVPAAVFSADARGRITFANARWRELHTTGSGSSLHDVVAPRDHARLHHALAVLVAPGGSDTLRIEVGGVDGDRVLAVSARAVRDPEGKAEVVVGAVEDVTGTAALRNRADRDPLTGLLNRSALHQRLESVVEVGDASVVVLFIDLDGFKSINDSLGHQAGDTALVEIGRRLGRAVRPDDMLARYGGDEFVVVCHDIPEGDEPALVSRLHLSLSGPVELGAYEWHPRASIGSVRLSEGDDVDGLLRRADQAMYEVKRVRADP